MKKIFNFVKKSSFIAAICLIIANSLIAPNTIVQEDNSSTTFQLQKSPNERPLDNPEQY